MTALQFDLFSSPALPRPAAPPRIAAPVAPSLASLLPRSPPIAWERRIERAGDVPLELHVSLLWTGVVVEVLSLPEGRIFLYADGTVRDGVPADERTYRAVFVTPAEARAIARKNSLALVGAPGTAACRLVAGAYSQGSLSVAEWLDGIEAAGAADGGSTIGKGCE